MTARRLALGALWLALASCFDSLVTDPCATGFGATQGECVANPGGGAVDAGPDGDLASDARIGPAPDARPDAQIDAGVDARIDAGVDARIDARIDAGVDARIDAGVDAQIDAGVDARIDAAPDAAVDAGIDAPVCTPPTVLCSGSCVDRMDDPNNCGSCGRVCASGVCTAGVCTGSLRGHIIAIGHDYRSFHPAMARVIGNAIALGAAFDVRVGRWHGASTVVSQNGVTQAITSAMQRVGRPWHTVAVPASPTPGALIGVDVFVIDAQTGNGGNAQASGAAWSAEIASFLARGGVVVVLEGSAGVSYRFALGAGLYVVGAPVDATGQLTAIVDGTDVTTQQVVTPYLAETSSVSLPGSPAPAITTVAGGTIVFHTTR